MIRRKEKRLEGLISWLKYLDIEYLSYEEAIQLSVLDINNPEQMQETFRLAVLPEFNALNPVSKISMRSVLKEALSATEEELQPVFDRVGMPFPQPVASKQAFLKALQSVCGEHQV